jgi:hypothetical protein
MIMLSTFPKRIIGKLTNIAKKVVKILRILLSNIFMVAIWLHQFYNPRWDIWRSRSNSMQVMNPQNIHAIGPTSSTITGLIVVWIVVNGFYVGILDYGVYMVCLA